MTTPETSVGELAESVTSSFTNVTILLTGTSYIIGVGFTIGALFKFKQHSSNPTQVPLIEPLTLLGIAAGLLFLPSIAKAQATKLTGVPPA
jgi:intracellular multiplication protein IcmD